jgi:AdoMet-dependent rRNA methyltransferase SPB1
VVCTGYNAPSVVEPQLLDPKVVFNDSLRENPETVTSLKQLLQEKKHRGGYEDSGQGFVYDKTRLIDFIRAVNPFMTLKGATELLIDDEAKELIKTSKAPADLELMCKDVKVQGKRDLSVLLKWRTKVLHKISKDKKQKEEDAMASTMEKVEEKVLDEEEEIAKFIEMRDKKSKKEKKKQNKKMEKKKKTVRDGQFAGEDNIDEDLGFDELLDDFDEIDNVGYISLSDTDEEIERQGFKVEGGMKELEEIDEEDEEKQLEQMNADFEDQHKKEQEESVMKRKAVKRERKRKGNELSSDEEADAEESDKEDGKKPKEGGDVAEPEGFKNPLKGKIAAIMEKTNDELNEEKKPKKGKKGIKRGKPEKGEEEDNDIQGLKKEKTERDKRKDKKKHQRERLEQSGKVGKGRGFEEVPQENNIDDEGKLSMQ